MINISRMWAVNDKEDLMKFLCHEHHSFSSRLFFVLSIMCLSAFGVLDARLKIYDVYTEVAGGKRNVSHS